MTIRSADPQTIAPRLSYVEDAVAHLLENPSSGGSDPSALHQKLWRATLVGSEASGMSTSDPWTATNLVYAQPSRPSLHQTIFGLDPEAALACQDGKGLFGWVFRPDETR